MEAATGVDEFTRYAEVLHGLTVDFVRAVPDERWHFTPDPPEKWTRPRPRHRIGKAFAPFCKQLRHVVCVRGVYNAALASKRVDWAGKHDHYTGPLNREALLGALEEQQERLLGLLEGVDIHAPIDWGGIPFTFAFFTWEWVQHEAIHHGQ